MSDSPEGTAGDKHGVATPPNAEHVTASAARATAATATVTETATATSTTTAMAVAKDEVPDPDEDDLDDLDDMLDDFSAVKSDEKKADATKSGPVRPASATPHAPPRPEESAAGLQDLFADDELQKQLEAGMADLMGDLESDPAMQAQLESIFEELGVAEASGSTGSATTEASSSQSSAKAQAETVKETAQDAGFQNVIRKTMERMQASGEQATATAAAAAENTGDDLMAEMMKAMGDLGGEGSEEDFSKLLMGMMEQLTNKDILYEPMKELNDKFPTWLKKNSDTLSKEDLKRYREQQTHVADMVAKFEEPTYSDSNVADREYIVDRMQRMQAAGSPPHDLLGDMPSANDLLKGGPEDGCAPQ